MIEFEFIDEMDEDCDWNGQAVLLLNATILDASLVLTRHDLGMWALITHLWARMIIHARTRHPTAIQHLYPLNYSENRATTILVSRDTIGTCRRLDAQPISKQ